MWIKKSMKLHSVICNAPAKALIKGTVQFNGYFGCDKYEEKGIACRNTSSRHAWYASIDAIATSVFYRMRDAGLLPQQPAPVPNPVPVDIYANTGLTGFYDRWHRQYIWGYNDRSTTDLIPSKFITHSLPLGYNVSDKVKQSIWWVQFVELGQLCGTHKPSETILFQNADSPLKISSGPKPSKMLNSDHHWTNCFNIFMSIYLTGCCSSLITQIWSGGWVPS